MEIADAVAIAVSEGADVEPAEHRILVPGRSRVVASWSSIRHNTPIVANPHVGEYALGHERSFHRKGASLEANSELVLRHLLDRIDPDCNSNWP